MKTAENNTIAKDESLSALVVKAKTGDQEAFSELYNKTSAELYRSIRAMTRDEDLSWDIQQDSYLRAFQNLDKLENDEAFLPWLRRIAANVTATKMSKRLPVTFTDLAGDSEDAAIPELPDLNPASQPELSLDRKETSRLVQEILSKLPEGQQMILGMRYYDELSVKEIAQLLKLSDGTVKAALFQGRKKVETAVRALEKQGVKLYGLSPVAFLVALMRRMEPAAAEHGKQAAVKAAVTKVSADAVAATAVPVAAKTFGQVLTGRVLAGALTVALIGGGIWGGAKLLKSNQRDNPYQPTTVITSERLSGVETPEEIPDTGEDLPVITEPVVTEPVVTEPTEPSAPTEPTKPTEATEPTEETVNPDWPSGSCGENLTWRFDPETGLLTIEGSGAMQDYPMFQGGPWSALRQQITAISLPDGLTTIGDSAFTWCSALASVTIPDSVTSIGHNAFLSCDALTSITIPNSVTSIGNQAFYDCAALTSVTIPDSVTSIGDGAFRSCAALAGVTIPDSVTSIGHNAFLSCDALTSITIPNSVTSIGNQAFYDCAALTSVSIGSGVENVGGGVFARCGSLTSIDIASDNPYITCVDGVLFNKNRTKLIEYLPGKTDTLYEIPDSVTSVGDRAFECCYALNSVTIPDSVTSIGDGAFRSCAALASVTIPDSVTSIGNHAFQYCYVLTSVTIPSSVTSIGDGAFFQCGLTSVTIPDSVTSIGDGAFFYCTALTSVTIPNSVTSIGNQAFYDCAALTSVTIPDSVTSIGNSAFLGCNALTGVTIPDSVTSIGESAFGYSGLEKMEGFTIIGVPGSEAERYANENGFTFIDVNTAAATELEVILARQEQDEAERSALSGTWSVAYGGDTRITEINKVGSRYQAKVVRTVAVTASEAELAKARQRGWIFLNGTKYRYTDSQEQLDEWLEGSIMQHSISVPEDGVILDASLGSAAEAFTGKGGFYEVGKVGDIYVFAYSAAGGFWQRIENTANEDLVWLDGDMPVVEGPSTGNRYTLSAYLQDHSISSGTHCSFQRDTDGEVFIYVDVR